MRLGIIDQTGNHGGGSRFIRALLPKLGRSLPEATIVYYAHPNSIKRENIAFELEDTGIELRTLGSFTLSRYDWFKNRHIKSFVALIQRKLLARFKFLHPSITGDLQNEIAHIAQNCDLMFFPWPFFIESPRVQCPVLAVIHDLNYKYFFGAPIFSFGEAKQLDLQIGDWLRDHHAVVSSEFIKGEIERFYPEASSKVHMIRLAPFSLSKLDNDDNQAVLHKFNIKKPFIIYPTHLTIHKNLGPLFAALDVLKQKGFKLTLLLTGSGSEHLKGSACPTGMMRTDDACDIVGLGYVSHREIDMLIQEAVAVVSSSLYEAGNGPGMDAWQLGTPVAMSNIPAFREHLAHLGVQAKLFNPRDPKDIAEKIAEILTNPERSQAESRLSKKAVAALDWTVTAEAYASLLKSIFLKA